ncbi:MAG: prolyl oligopeptidase family serine peptidase [Planctomycetota bacterium]|nr:prolyl oligopeptidase family serine peptidase [Planctomycetota bacterium]
MRAGIAAVALDLPGHGERFDPSMQMNERSMDVVNAMVPEIDRVVDAMAAPEWGDYLDFARMGIGGMSAGGMAALRRLCDGHDFVCAAVEGTTGWLEGLYFPSGQSWQPPRGVSMAREGVLAADAMSRLDTFRPIPALFLHAETDRIVPIGCLTTFLEALRLRYERAGTDPDLIRLKTWSQTGAPEEHAGFGKFGHEAKNVQVEFLARYLGAAGPVREDGPTVD